MTKKTCAGCDSKVTSYTIYSTFVLCDSCDKEMIEDDSRKQEDEEALAEIVCGRRKVWVFETEAQS